MIPIISTEMHSMKEGYIGIVIEPSMAFGTGHHPTTKMCISLIKKYYDGEIPKVKSKNNNSNNNKPAEGGAKKKSKAKKSAPKKKTAAKAVINTTITEPVNVSLEVGQVTLLPSLLTS